MEVILSPHAEKRLSERLGLNRKAAKRYTSQVFEKGIPPEDYYFKEIAKKFELKKESDQTYLFYRDLLHVFRADTKTGVPVLVTVYDPIHQGFPKQYKAGKLTDFKKLRKS